MKTRDIFLYVTLLCIVLLQCDGRKRAEKSEEPREIASQIGGVWRAKRSTGSRCSSDIPLCRCRRKGTVVCTKANCLQRLPTRNMTVVEGSRIQNIVVSRQANFTVIRSQDLRVLPNLRSIRFYKNGIYAINSNAFTWTPDLERLDLHQNQLRYFPTAIRRLHKLRRLNLGGNKITAIPSGAFESNTKLEQLVLRRNRLESFPGLLPGGLVKLSIGENLLSYTGDLRYLKSLSILRLDSNRFVQINSHALPQSLHDLSMCNNLLTSDRTLSFDNLKQLRRLRLAGNVGIKRIHRFTFFRSANKVRVLDLRQCSISYIEESAFSCFPRLQTLELIGNDLTRYFPGWLVFNHNIRQVTLSGNPWRCDCAFISQLQDLTSAAEKAIAAKHDVSPSMSGSRKQIFSGDFSTIVCGEVDAALTGWKRTSGNYNLSSVDASSCNNDSTWDFLPTICPIEHIQPTPESSSRQMVSNSTSTIAVTATSAKTTKLRPVTTTTSLKPTTITRATTDKPTTTTTIRPTTTLTVRPTTTTIKPTTTTTTTTTVRPTTTTTTVRPTTTSTVRPTTTTIRLTTTSTVRPTTTTTTTTIRPTTATTVRPTTTTTLRSTTRSTTSTTRLTTTAKPSTSKRTTSAAIESNIDPQQMCTVAGDVCHFPFTYQGETYTNECAPGYFGKSWCYYNENEDWDNCKPCTEL